MQQGPMNQAQIAKLEINYINPILDLIIDELDDNFKTEQKFTVLEKLLNLIIAEKDTYEERLNLSIHEGEEQSDDMLKMLTASILEGSDVDQDVIYKSLYQLLHEYRFNKSPDPKNIDDLNALAAVRYRGNDLYANTKAKVDTVAHRLMTDGGEPSTEAIDTAFCQIVRKIYQEKRKDAQIDQEQEQSQAPINHEEKVEILVDDEEKAIRKAMALSLAQHEKELEAQELEKAKELSIELMDKKRSVDECADDALIAQLLQQELNGGQYTPHALSHKPAPKASKFDDFIPTKESVRRNFGK